MMSGKHETEVKKMQRIRTTIFAGLFAAAVSACADGDLKHGVSFETPKDGATVSQEFKVEMEVQGMKVNKAGPVVEGTGHFHVIIDNGYTPKGRVVPGDATHKHFGKGQFEAELKLAPGAHTLTLQFANGQHVSYGKEWSKTIHITVK